MKALRAFLLVAGLASSIATFALDAKSDFQKLYTKAANAMKSKNVTVLFGMTTPDFTYKSKEGMTMKRKEVEAQMKAQFSMLKSVTTSTMTVKSATVTGNKATVVATGVFEGKIANPQTKKDVVVKSISETKDTWIKGKSGWKLQSIVTVKETTTMDGKEIAPPSATRNN